MRAVSIVALCCLSAAWLLCGSTEAGAAASPVAEAEPSFVHDGSATGGRTDIDFLISGILEHILRPLAGLLRRQILSIIRSIKDQGGHITGRIIQQIDRIVEIIRPFVIRIIGRINDIIGAGIDLKEKISMVVEKLFEYLDIINDSNREIVRRLIDYIKEKLLGSIREADLQQLESEPLFIDSIKEWLIRPIVQLIRRQVISVIRTILDQTGHIASRLLEHVDTIAELIRPSVIRILDIAGNMHGDLINLRENVKEAVTRILGNISSIGEESRHVLEQLIELVTDKILESIRPPKPGSLAGAENQQQFLIIGRIIRRIMRPIVNRLNSILDRIRQLVNEKTEEAKAKLLELYNELTLLLKAPVVRILGVLQDIGVDIKDTAAAVRRTLQLIFDSIAGIREENRQLLRTIVTEIMGRLLGMLRDSSVMRLQYSILVEIINRIMAPIVPRINDLLTQLREELQSGIGSIAETVNRYVEQLAQLLSPYVAAVVRIIRQIGIGGQDMMDNVRRALELAVRNLRGIAEANRQLLWRLVSQLVARIIEIVEGSAFP